MTRKSSRFTIIGLVFSLALIAGLAWMAKRQSDQILVHSALVNDTYRSNDLRSEVIKYLLDVEAAQRGYVLTGDGSFLPRFNSDLRAISRHLSELDQATRGSRLRADFEELARLIPRRVELARNVVELRSASGFEAAQQEVAKGEGKRLVDRIRAIDETMELHSQALLIDRSEAVEREAGLANVLQTFEAVVTVVVLVAVFVLTWKEEQLRTRLRVAEWESHVDPLTQIENRRGIVAFLESELASTADPCLSVVMMDVDDFKKYNDAYGHLAGDDVLRSIGDVLVRELRTGDKVGRFGGEEFLIVLPFAELQDAVLVADRLRKSVQSLKGLRRKVTASFGVSCSTVDGQSLSELVSLADMRLYAAKAAGKNRVVPRVPRRAVIRAELDEKLVVGL